MSQRGPKWTVATARQNLPKLLSLAAREPQEVYRRDNLVARVVAPDVPTPARKTLADAFAELRQICAEEDYEFMVPERRDRPNPIVNPRSKPKKKAGSRKSGGRAKKRTTKRSRGRAGSR